MNAFTTAWRSPSNIAIIKYWGKHGDQLPDNPSLSFTLSAACTETKVTAIRTSSPEITFTFHNTPKEDFAAKIRTYISRIAGEVPFVREHSLHIESINTFPHSSGIASSASSMSALALCLAQLQQITSGNPEAMPDFRLASLLARMGSGSACRSVFGPVCAWGQTPLIPGTSDLFGIPVTDVHSVFTDMHDSILIIDDGVKSVSSSAGHALMSGHPFGASRVQQANRHFEILLHALRTGDVTLFGQIAEAEALMLHALMMTSDPPYLLFHANTITGLNHVRAFRAETGVPVYFTLDAGPNVHLLYRASDAPEVQKWIEKTLTPLCKNGLVIHDRVGSGPILIR